MKKIVRKLGESKIISIPPRFCENLGIEIDSVLNVEQIGKQIIITTL